MKGLVKYQLPGPPEDNECASSAWDSQILVALPMGSEMFVI